MRAEVRSVFNVPMRGDPTFPFCYLQSMGGGAKTLTKPAVSASFLWNAQQVAKLTNSKGTIYVMAEGHLEGGKVCCTSSFSALCCK